MKDVNEALDERFRRWAASRQSADAHLRQLTARIVREACRRRRLDEPAAAPVAPWIGRRRPAWVASLATVAACLAIAVAVRLRPQGPPAPGPELDHAREWARIPEAKAAGDRQLFGEMQRLFAEQFRWVAEANGGVRVSVADLPGGADPDTKPVALRLVIVARDRSDAAWRPVWRSDVLLRAEERVHVPAGRDQEGALSVWVHAVGNGAIAVEADVRVDAPVRLASTVDSVFTDGVPAEIAALQRGDREYRVLQSVRLL